MKAIIEIPDDLIRAAGHAIMLSHPHVTPIVNVAIDRLKTMDTLTLNFDDTSQKDSVEANTAMMCVTQIMADIAKDYERN